MASNTQPHHSWTQLSDGEWEQPYGFQDAFYGRFVGKSGEPALFLVATSIKFRCVGDDSSNTITNRLRDAWIQMRFAYPIIATVAHENRRTYRVIQRNADADAWATKTFKIQTTRTIPEIWSHLVKTEQPTLHFFPKTGELFLQAEHTHFDGRGLLHFWDEFFTLLANPRPIVLGQDIGNLPGRADDYVNTTERSPGRGSRLASHMLESMEVSSPDTPIMYHRTSTELDHHPILVNCRATFGFSPKETNKINDACKDRNLSLTALWHAAVVFATRDIQRDAGTKPGSVYGTFANFDLRRYFTNDSREKAKGQAPIGNFHAVIPYVAKPNGRSFLDVAQDLSSFYRLGFQEQPNILSALRPMMATMGDVFAQGPPSDTTPAISSLGITDYYIKQQYKGSTGNYAVDDPWFGDTVTGPWMECFVWLWKGSLILGSCFNGAFYTQEEVDAFHKRVAGHIVGGLGLSNGGSIPKL